MENKTILDTMDLFESLVKAETEYAQELINENELPQDTDTEEFGNESAMDSYSDYLQDEIDYISDVIYRFVARYEKRYNTTITDVAFIGGRSSHYGSIGGAGASVGRVKDIEDIESIFMADEFSISITDNKNLQFNAYDHDGTNSMQMVLMTENERNKVEYMEYDYSDSDFLVYLQSKKATRLDNEFLSELGLL